MAYGIDSTIQDKVNTFRGQPQQLMQQYGQSQQLVDLLALQQIKSEKEAAARQIQMAMAQKQGQPTTIAQQREQEVMGLTRNEIAKRVQQGMPQQPQAPQQAPQQGPQGGGISALPAPNMQGMQNMAGGGIVAFASGDSVPNPDDGAPENETEDERTLRIQKYLAMVQADKERQAPLIAARQAAKEATNQRATQGDPGAGENALASMMASLNAPGTTSGNTAALSLETPDATGKAGVDISQEAYRAMKAQERAAKEQRQSVDEAPPAASSGRTNVARDNLALRPLKRQEGLASLRAEAEGDNRVGGTPLAQPVDENATKDYGQGNYGPAALSMGLAALSATPIAGNLFNVKTGVEKVINSVPSTEHVAPTPKGPEISLPVAVQTVKDYVANASASAEMGGPPVLEELQYRNALRVLANNGISTSDLFRSKSFNKGSGFFGGESGILGMDEKGLQQEANTLNNHLKTIRAYKEYGMPVPEAYPSEEAITQRLKVVNTFLAPGSQTTATPQVTADAASAGIIPTGIAKLAADKAAPATQAAPVAQRTIADAASAGIIPTSTAPTTSSGGIEDIIKRINSGYNMDEINKQRADIAAQIAKLNAEQNDPSTQNRDRLAAFLSAAGAGTSLASGARLGGAAVNELNATRQAARAAQLKDLQTTADSRAKELMEMGMKRTDAVERAYAEANQTAAVRENTAAVERANRYGVDERASANAATLKSEENRAELLSNTQLSVALIQEQGRIAAQKTGISPDEGMRIMNDIYRNDIDYAAIRQSLVGKGTPPKQGVDLAFDKKVAAVARDQAYSLFLDRQLPGSHVTGTTSQVAPTSTQGVNPNDPMAKYYR